MKYPNDFEAFWKIYPKKVGKGNTFKQWTKSKKNCVLPDLDLLIEKLRNQGAYKKRMILDGKFVPDFPDPERWIKGARWEDEIIIEQQENKLVVPAIIKCKFCHEIYRVIDEHKCQLKENI